MIKISASIVIYNENKETLKKVIDSFLSINLEKELVIVDNSSNPYLEEFIDSYPYTKYLFRGENLGFGAGHNYAFENLSKRSDFHLILNPDIYFSGVDIGNLVLWLNKNKDISLCVPKVFYPDEILQNTIRNIPKPMTLIKRRFNINGVFNDFIKKDEFQNVQFTQVSEIPFAHGCFFIFQTEVFEKLNGFDERFFMYMEDVDICLRAKKFGKIVINPNYKIYHEYRKGSSKNFKLLLWHIISAIKFFYKYKNFD